MTTTVISAGVRRCSTCNAPLPACPSTGTYCRADVASIKSCSSRRLLADPEDPLRVTNQTRDLGLIVRSTSQLSSRKAQIRGRA